MKYKVVAGDYKHWDVVFSFDKMYFMSGMKKEKVDSTVVSNWNVVDDVSKNSFWAPTLGAGIGGLIFGAPGAIAGAAIGSGTNTNKSEYFISIEFFNGKKALVKVDNDGYKKILTCLY